MCFTFHTNCPSFLHLVLHIAPSLVLWFLGSGSNDAGHAVAHNSSWDDSILDPEQLGYWLQLYFYKVKLLGGGGGKLLLGDCG